MYYNYEGEAGKICIVQPMQETSDKTEIQIIEQNIK